MANDDIDIERAAQMQRLLASGGTDAVKQRFGEAALNSKEMRLAQQRQRNLRQQARERREEAIAHEEERQREAERKQRAKERQQRRQAAYDAAVERNKTRVNASKGQSDKALRENRQQHREAEQSGDQKPLEAGNRTKETLDNFRHMQQMQQRRKQQAMNDRGRSLSL